MREFKPRKKKATSSSQDFSGLVLARGRNQSIWIGDDIRITILAIEGGTRVKLLFQAPDGVVILREELKEIRDSL